MKMKGLNYGDSVQRSSLLQRKFLPVLWEVYISKSLSHRSNYTVNNERNLSSEGNVLPWMYCLHMYFSASFFVYPTSILPGHSHSHWGVSTATHLPIRNRRPWYLTSLVSLKSLQPTPLSYGPTSFVQISLSIILTVSGFSHGRTA